jgi:hypothetical protein
MLSPLPPIVVGSASASAEAVTTVEHFFSPDSRIVTEASYAVLANVEHVSHTFSQGSRGKDIGGSGTLPPPM